MPLRRIKIIRRNRTSDFTDNSDISVSEYMGTVAAPLVSLLVTRPNSKKIYQNNRNQGWATRSPTIVFNHPLWCCWQSDSGQYCPVAWCPLWILFTFNHLNLTWTVVNNYGRPWWLYLSYKDAFAIEESDNKTKNRFQKSFCTGTRFSKPETDFG